MHFVTSKSLCYEYLAGVGLDRFFFKENRSFRFEIDKRTKNETIVLKNISFLKTNCFQKNDRMFVKKISFLKNDLFQKRYVFVS